MSPQVVEQLLGRIPKTAGSGCRLWGYSRHPVRDHVFPAIIPASSKSHVDGMVWLELTDTEMKIFDYFEDVEYKRIPVNVEPLGDENPKDASSIAADAYIWSNPTSELELEKEWSFENFCTKHLDWYLANTVRNCKEDLDRMKEEL
jgi:Gamma-glutamyl cyclotransferase, AIG2-like